MKYLPTILIILISLSLKGQDIWIIDKNGCKVYNPNPRKQEIVEWTGDCIDSIVSGNGQLIWSFNGKDEKATYTGEMHNGRPEGKGKYVFSTGTIYEGEFKNGDLINGKETLFLGKTDTLTYIGLFKNRMHNGHGTLNFSSKEWFIGEFKDDKLLNGVYTSKIYGYVIESNDWKGFVPKSGKITYENGMIYDGDLKNFSPHGYGTIIYSDGAKESGKWKNGKLVK